jgi:hypothetical protein
LAAEGTNTEAILRKEVQRQSETNVSVRNVITSMRLVSTIIGLNGLKASARLTAFCAKQAGLRRWIFPPATFTGAP